VADLPKRGRGPTAHLAGGGILALKSGIGRLQLLQLVEKSVVLRVGKLWRVEDVVEVVVMSQLLPKLGDLPPGRTRYRLLRHQLP
jgi:hypothetical protein